jgi:hypothetical protein
MLDIYWRVLSVGHSDFLIILLFVALVISGKVDKTENISWRHNLIDMSLGNHLIFSLTRFPLYFSILFFAENITPEGL